MTQTTTALLRFCFLDGGSATFRVPGMFVVLVLTIIGKVLENIVEVS